MAEVEQQSKKAERELSKKDFSTYRYEVIRAFDDKSRELRRARGGGRPSKAETLIHEARKALFENQVLKEQMKEYQKQELGFRRVEVIVRDALQALAPVLVNAILESLHHPDKEY